MIRMSAWLGFGESSLPGSWRAIYSLYPHVTEREKERTRPLCLLRRAPILSWESHPHDQVWQCQPLSCVQLCNSTGCSPPSSAVHEISQARILEGIAISFSREGIQPGSPPALQVDSLPAEPPRNPHSHDLTTSQTLHLLIPSQKGLGIQHMNFEETHTCTWSINLKEGSQSPRASHTLYDFLYVKGPEWANP